jgi:cytochrome c oxidase cbb3-type subunit IV
MDINDLRSIVTTISMLTFVGIVVWAWSKRNQSGFDEAAQLPFTDD